MTDRELLELASKAAGIRVLAAPVNAAKHDSLYCWINKTRKPWNPLTDDGDEACLEATLSLWVSWYPAMVLVGPEPCFPATGMAYAQYFDKHAGDKQAARRRAGVLAAAEIGKAMP